MSYTHLTTAERVKIETHLELGMSIRSIARQPSTVSREIRRNPGYESGRAQRRYTKMKANNCGVKTKLDEMMSRTIIKKLRATCPPEQIVGRLFRGRIAFSTIYRWIYAGRIDVPVTVLRQKGKRRKPVETRERINVGLTISDRPREVRTHETFGHWELDTVVSGRGKSKVCVATFVERKSRFYLALSIADRGKEFSCHERVRASLGVRSVSPRQGGSNENANGLLREFFPKGLDFATVGQGEMVDALAKINGRTRKCQGWKTAHEAFTEEVLRLI
ncbi:IS30 family transposase [Exiguobacterium sp. ZOR0005]|uniref:IS30 family transposase n=1 Tax=Exiguobacterium sp. ZOR0005 TaxID=1339226 RepID=UPI0006463053|nr:IS30 family transposase [Exiguobacterium sp. ZOR0005]